MDSLKLTPSTFVIAGLGVIAYMMMMKKGNFKALPQQAKNDEVLGTLTSM